MNGYSYSAINTYQRCPQQYVYKFIDKIQRAQKSVALFNGINAHEMMKVFFLMLQMGHDKEYAWNMVLEHVEVLTQEASEVMFDDELASAVDEIKMILLVVKNYIDQYSEDWEILHVEEEFIIMLDTGQVVTFTPDLVVRDRNGSVWIVDHKTTSGGVEGGVPFGDMQALLYYAGVKSLYPETAGFLFSRMRKKLPTQPRLTKTGKTRVADLARIDTTYEILRDFLQETAPGLLNDETHMRRLAELRDQGNRFFWHEQVYVNDATVESILMDVGFVIEQIELSKSRGVWPRHLFESRGYKDCRKCEFEPICQASLLGWDTQDLILDEYEPRDPKNPYQEEDDG